MTTAKDIFFVDSFFLDTQNNVNIDYVEAINRLLQCNVDPFVSNTPNLLFSCLDTVSKNPDIPPFIDLFVYVFISDLFILTN
jgi:hypothetical protein